MTNELKGVIEDNSFNNNSKETGRGEGIFLSV